MQHKDLWIARGITLGPVALAFPVATFIVFGLGADRDVVADIVALVYSFGLFAGFTTSLWPLASLRAWTRADRIASAALVFMIVSYLTHLTWELGWLLLHEEIRAGRDLAWTYPWWAYIDGGDMRYAEAPPTLVSMEVLSVVNGLVGAVGLATWLGSGRRDIRGVLLCMATAVVHLYSASLYFLSEIVAGMPNVDTTSALDTYVKFGLANAPWIVFPWFVLAWGWGELRGEIARREACARRARGRPGFDYDDLRVIVPGRKNVNWYRIKTAFIGIKRLATLPEEDKQACIDAYKFFQRMQAGEETKTEDETKAVADYYKVLNNMLSVFDLEKLYIPPMLNDAEGLYANQLLCEQALVKELALDAPEKSHLLDMGCGRGRISHHFATMTGGRVSGYNIDPNQIENAVDWAEECGMSDRLHFRVGDHHKPLEYESETFDGCFSFQAVWPFFKKEELDAHAEEMYRVLKPGARYACSEYLLTPHFDWNDEEHVTLHKTFLPTLAATQSMYPADVCAALERAGFEVLLSAPSKSEAWPLCEQKRDLILRGRKIIRGLEAMRVLPPWVEESLDLLQKGGEAWTQAERAKIADLNWRIVAEKR